MEGEVYQCIEVFKESNHPLAKYVEDESEMFILEGGSPNWWTASDFFYCKGEMILKEVKFE